LRRDIAVVKHLWHELKTPLPEMCALICATNGMPYDPASPIHRTLNLACAYQWKGIGVTPTHLTVCLGSGSFKP
jgi:hypothetical protein